MGLKTALTVAEMLALRAEWRASGAKVALVPTMGALHEGHLSLVRAARSAADVVVVSIFVNPLQFGPNEDFAKYPRTLAQDLELLSEHAEAVFLPTANTMYLDGHATTVSNQSMAAELCGASRPGHFDGVLTVVLKLFNIVGPQRAYFGKKDYQQWRLIERMARDLNLPVEVIGVDTIRDPDGLAMSSRNRYLSPEERTLALGISRGLAAAQALSGKGQRDVSALVAACAAQIPNDPVVTTEYIELRRASDLRRFEGPKDGPGVMLVAARVGSTRLIDNKEL